MSLCLCDYFYPSTAVPDATRISAQTVNLPRFLVRGIKGGLRGRLRTNGSLGSRIRVNRSLGRRIRVNGRLGDSLGSGLGSGLGSSLRLRSGLGGRSIVDPDP
jgi:hypothetical protein